MTIVIIMEGIFSYAVSILIQMNIQITGVFMMMIKNMKARNIQGHPTFTVFTMAKCIYLMLL